MTAEPSGSAPLRAPMELRSALGPCGVSGGGPAHHRGRYPQATPVSPPRCRGVVLIKGYHDGASDREIEHHRPAVHARQQVGETRLDTEVIHASSVSPRDASCSGRRYNSHASLSFSAAFSVEAHCDHRQRPASRNSWTISINELVTGPTSAARGKSRSRQMAVPFGASRSATVIPQM